LLVFLWISRNKFCSLKEIKRHTTVGITVKNHIKLRLLVFGESRHKRLMCRKSRRLLLDFEELNKIRHSSWEFELLIWV
jgi:hypothetical protein